MTHRALLLLAALLLALPGLAAPPQPATRPAASQPVAQAADSSILLHARDVTIHGTTVRYEPKPEKNTIGFWTKKDDWVSWDFTVTQPGTFRLVAMQGCGKGSGGSEVEFTVAPKGSDADAQTLKTTVQDTGGFQAFVERDLGAVTLKPGPYTLSVKPLTKPGLAVMDLRQVLLKSATDEPQAKVTHSFLACGAETYILDDAGKEIWRYPLGTRDAFVLPDGHLLLAITKCDQYPGGAAIEITRDGQKLFEYKGTQSEVNTVSRTPDGHYVLTEAGPKPRLLELDHDGKPLVNFPLQCQTRDTHLGTRMTRKLPNGNYLVPQLLDKVVREYTPTGTIASEFKTPNEPKECWPFTAIRLPNGNTLVTITHGNGVLEFDPAGKIGWQFSNADLPEPLIVDACGAQRLPNGDTVITAYGQNKPGAVKLLEVTPDKKLVWTWRDQKNHGIHEFQILTTNGKPIEGTPLK